MKKFTSVLIALLLVPGYVIANPTLDEDTVKAISQEFTQAMKNGDMSVFEKYMYPGSKIVVDMDPSNSSGQIDISYDQFMQLTEMAIGLMEDAEIHEEVISVTVDEKSNQATIKEKTSATIEMMGMKMRDVSIATTTYGVIDGQIKVLSTEDQLISSGPVE